MSTLPSNLLQQTANALKAKTPTLQSKDLGSATAAVTNNNSQQNNQAVKVTLSQEAKAILQYVSATHQSGDSSKASVKLLDDIMTGVSQQLTLAPQAGPDGAQKIQQAGAAFFNEVAAVAKQANGQPLNQAQINQIAKADDSFHKIVDGVQGNSPASGDGAKIAGQIVAKNGDSGEADGGEGSGDGKPETKEGAIAAQAAAGGGASGTKKSKKYNPDDLNKDGKVSTMEKQIAHTRKAAEEVQTGSDIKPDGKDAG